MINTFMIIVKGLAMGAADIVPGVSGLVHVSEMSEERVKDVEEYLSEGDTVKVKVIEVDKFGRLKLSAKAVQALTKKES